MYRKDLLPLEGFGGQGAQPSNRPEVRAEQRAAALRAGRTPIGLWDLMLWAYRDELVRYTCGTDFRPGFLSSNHSSTAWVMAAGQSGAMLGGVDRTFSASPCCHDDALILHEVVLEACANAAGRDGADTEARSEAFQMLIVRAERNTPPDWDPDVSQPAKIVPVLKPNGKPQCIADASRHAIACVIRYVGYSPEEAESVRMAARAQYGRWIALLEAVMHTLMPVHGLLIRWKVTGLGVERAPWAGPHAKAG